VGITKRLAHGYTLHDLDVAGCKMHVICLLLPWPIHSVAKGPSKNKVPFWPSVDAQKGCARYGHQLIGGSPISD